MNRHASRGFSLIELSFVVLLIGLMLAITVPAYNGFRSTNDVKGVTQNIAGQLRLARESAISTGAQNVFHVNVNFLGTSDYHTHRGGGGLSGQWRLPKKVTFYFGTGTYSEYRFGPDGRCLDSGWIIVQNTRGLRDTVAVQLSGLVLVK